MTFSVTPILFNVGINEHATIAGRVTGANAPQDRNNVDNFKILQVLKQLLLSKNDGATLVFLAGVSQEIQEAWPSLESDVVQPG